MTDERQTGEEVVVLREIWNELKSVHSSLKGELSRTREELSRRVDGTNSRIDELSHRVDGMNTRIDEVRDELKLDGAALRHSLVEGEIRVATAVTDLTGTINGLREAVTGWRADQRVDRDQFRRRIERLEEHAGLLPPEP
jgi:chromosome segregation ATPase